MKKLNHSAKRRIQAALAVAQAKLAQDAELSPGELLEVIGSLTQEVETAQDDGENVEQPTETVGSDSEEEETAADEAPEDEAETAEDEGDADAPEAPEGGAEKPAQDRAISRVAMDAAIQKAVTAERKRAQALSTAQREVAHLVGEVAMDSAEDVYRFALEQNGVDVSGVHPSAYRAMVGMLNKPKAVAMDGAHSGASQQFPGLKRIRKG